MGPSAKSLGRKAAAVLPLLKDLNSTQLCSVIFGFRSVTTISSESYAKLKKPCTRKPTVALFWDLDNKPPKNVSPFKAATRLKQMAAEFGEVVDIVAYANQHAFSHVPSWIHEERRQRKILDVMEATGEVKPDQPYVCVVCGSKKKTHVELTRHFKMLHEKEQKKRMNHLESLKGKKRQKQRFWENNVEKMAKYNNAAKGIIIPKLGYGLMQDIKRAGVYVRTVKDEPQAADIALKEHMMKSIKRGVNCLCLVSDDTDFKPELKLARERSLHTVVVGDLRILSAYSDTYYSWAEVATGRAEQKAKMLSEHLRGEFGNALGYGLDLDEESSRRELEFDPNEILEEDDLSDIDSEAHPEGGWRPTDRFVDVEEDHSFDSFSDDTSGSDSESDMEADVLGPPKGRRGRTNSKFGTSSTPSTGRRGFATEREVVFDGWSSNEGSLKSEKGATEAESNVGKPEKLHYFFTMLESANKGIISTATQIKLEALEEGDHFKKVQSILTSCRNDRGGGQATGNDNVPTAKDHPRRSKEFLDIVKSSPREEGNKQDLSRKEDVRSISASGKGQGESRNQKDRTGSERHIGHAEDLNRDEIWGSFASEEGEEESRKHKCRTRFGRRVERGQDNNQERFLSSPNVESVEGSSEQISRTRFGPRFPKSHDRVGKTQDCNGQENFLSGSMNERVEEDRKQTKGTRFGRRVSERPRTRRVIKVVSEGPRPFYLSGFASESQADCNAVNRYYQEWWGNPDDPDPDYKVKQKKKWKRAR